MSERRGLDQVVERSLLELGSSVVPRAPAFMGKPETSHVQRPDHQDEMRLLMRIVQHPDETIEERADALGWERTKASRVGSKARKLGVLTEAGKIGKRVFFEPTEKGLRIAKERRTQIPKFKSGWFHNVVLLLVMKFWGLAIEGVRFRQGGGEINSTQADALATLEGGETIATQICATNAADYEVNSAKKLVEHPMVDGVLVVTTKREKARLIQKKMSQAISREQREGKESEARERVGSSLLQKVMVMDAAEILNGTFDWSSVPGARESEPEERRGR